MAIVNLTGLPETCKLQKIVFLFKNILKRDGVSRFWIKDMEDIRGAGVKSATIEFDSPDDAYRASKTLNGFVYNDGHLKYPLTARMESDSRARPRRRSPSPLIRGREREHRGGDRYEDRHRYERFDSFSRDRERSPLNRETSELDLEIELLRKRRMIIEEERRLLLERKKLELVKEFGPSALKEFKSLEDRRDRRYRSPERAPKPRRPPLPPPPPRFRPRSTRPPMRERPGPAKLPQFNLPCKLLLEEMEDVMNRLGSPKEMSLLLKLVRSSIRRRLAVALEGKPILPGVKIVSLYRHKYPEDTDEELVEKHLKELRACHVPSSRGNEGTRKESAAKEDKGQENNEPNAKQHSDADNTDSANLTTEPEEHDLSDQVIKMIYETQKEVQKGDACSVGSSEALTLHDKNDEDWMEGVHGWEDSQIANP